jgi:malate dehydrogenase
MAKKAGVGVEEVENLCIWGNHSVTQYPDFYNTTINGKPVTEVINDEAWLQGEFLTTIQQRGAAIIKARGASSAASAANAVVDGIRSLVTESTDGAYYSMCLSSKGEYGVDEGLIFSYPCQTKNGECVVVEGITHEGFGKEKFDATLDELRSERDTVKSLGLI